MVVSFGREHYLTWEVDFSCYIKALRLKLI